MGNNSNIGNVRLESGKIGGRLIEEGEAFRELTGLAAGAGPRLDVIVIGAGQAGLSVGYHLARRGLRFVILDGNARIGDTWRRRWDSLRLFTPARFSSLDGMRFPAPPDTFPTKDQMADYLEAYAAHFALPVRMGVKVDRLFKQGGRYVVQAGAQRFEADQVVVAMASYQSRRVPDFAAALDPTVNQLHSSEYRSPAQLKEGAVLIAGSGNSGAEIAGDIARPDRPRRIWMSGRDTGYVPFRIDGFWARLFLYRFVLRFVFHRVLTVKTPMGRKARPKILHQGAPLIRTKPADLAAAGVERVAKVVGVRDGMPLLQDGRRLEVANVIWCTGYHPGFSWIDLPLFDEIGDPRHEGGVVPEHPGLYFVGLHFLYSMSSTMIHGVGRDAARIVDAVAARADTESRLAAG
jgi:putative flavoprotein involved in K+ transport